MKPRADVATYLNYIDGDWRAGSNGRPDASINPANRHELVGFVQNSSRSDVDAAVIAARKAWASWKKLPGVERAQYLYRMADSLERRIEDVAQTMTREIGKPLAEARAETARGVALLRYYAGEGLRSIGEVIPSADGAGLLFTSRVPLGVVGIVTPWNFPVAIPLWKLAPALICGNTVVLKPAQDAAVTAARLMACLHDAGLPAGVANLVTGDGAVIGQGLVDHPGVAAISFTGSNETGRRVAQAAIQRGAKYQLEMGAKNPLIVAEDADLDRAAEAAVSGGLRSSGQKCAATSRLIVHASVYDAFRDKLLDRVRALKLGDGMDPATWMGPCVNESQMHSVLAYVAKGLHEGATLLCGGRRAPGRGLEHGFFVEPTVFEDVSPGMSIAQEEIFGPVLALIKVDSLEEGLALANDTRYGLSASLSTRDIGRMLAFIEDMDAGLLRIDAEAAGEELQAPFGGMKGSGSHSREQGRAAIEFFTSVKTAFVKA